MHINADLMPHHANVGEVAQVLTVAETGKRLVQLRESARHTDARLDVVKQLQLRRLQRLAVVPGALIFYESPHRIVATLEAVAEVFPQREVAVCRELTKLHEEVLRGPAAQLAEELRARGEVKGEIALVIAPPSEDEEAGIVPVDAAAADPDEALREDIRAALEEGEPASAVAKRLSQKYSRRKRDVYAMVLDMQ